MKRLIILLCLIPTALWGAPSITVVTGTIGDGEAITISGSAFGTHADEGCVSSTDPNYLCYVWEDLEDQNAQGDSATLNIVNTYNRTGSSYHQYFPGANQGVTHSTQRWEYNTTGTPTSLYLDYWVRLDSTWDDYHDIQDFTNTTYDDDGVEDSQIKMYMIYVDTVSHAYSCIKWASTLDIYNSFVGTSGATTITSTYYTLLTPGNWHHMKVWYSRTDDVWSVTIDESTTLHAYGADWDPAASYITSFRYIGYVSDVAGYSQDDAYASFTQARVELGDNATYANCTHTEIQPPTAWATGEITAMVNLGSFESGTAYLFVVDSDGTVSDNDLETGGAQGYEVTIGEGSSPSTPTPTITGGFGGSLQ